MSVPDDPAAWAERAQRAYRAMRRRFAMRSGMLRRDGRAHLPGARAHLWPFARALVATLDLAGVSAELVPGFAADAAITSDVAALERFWDSASSPPAYSSDVIGSRFGGDRYYDDNAWVGLALVQLERMRPDPGPGRLERAAQVFEFAVSGWDRRPDVPSPGGVFWVEQGRGAGLRNHDRNTVSNAPNAQVGLHVAELRGDAPAAGGSPGPREMYEWVNATLDGGGGPPGTGLLWDKIRADESIDRKFWTYNQGSMVGLNVLLHRAAGGGTTGVYLERAQAIARAALERFAGEYGEHPPAFNAIFFRNLLTLHAATPDERLAQEIRAAMLAYAAGLPSMNGGRLRRGATLLDASAYVSIPALLAWDPADYGKLA